MKRRHFFERNQLNSRNVISSQPRKLFSQETDWTCSIACIRTMLSGFCVEVPSESEIVEKNNLQPGPYYSKDIKQIGFLDEYDVIYGCDVKQPNFDMVLEYMEKGYFVMLESMYNYAHWMVLLGYYPMTDNEIENSRLLLYDPYYNQVRLYNVDEFITMWLDGNHAENGIEKDFIAIKK